MNSLNIGETMSYTALVLKDESRQKLLSGLGELIPDGWEVIAHHMTVNMGAPENGPAHHMIGKEFSLTVVSFAKDDLVVAVGVESEVPSNNAQKHVTVAVNREAGGKPFLSNKLATWKPFSIPYTMPFELKGIVEEVV